MFFGKFELKTHNTRSVYYVSMVKLFFFVFRVLIIRTLKIIQKIGKRFKLKRLFKRFQICHLVKLFIFLSILFPLYWKPTMLRCHIFIQGGGVRPKI